MEAYTDQVKRKDVPFVRVRGKPLIGSNDRQLYVCGMCSTVCVSKTDHLLYHQRMIDMVCDIAYQKIKPESTEIEFRAVEVEKLEIVNVL